MFVGFRRKGQVGLVLFYRYDTARSVRGLRLSSQGQGYNSVPSNVFRRFFYFAKGSWGGVYSRESSGNVGFKCDNVGLYGHNVHIRNERHLYVSTLRAGLCPCKFFLVRVKRRFWNFQEGTIASNSCKGYGSFFQYRYLKVRLARGIGKNVNING